MGACVSYYNVWVYSLVLCSAIKCFCVILSSYELGSTMCLHCTIACHIWTALCVNAQVKIISCYFWLVRVSVSVVLV